MMSDRQSPCTLGGGCDEGVGCRHNLCGWGFNGGRTNRLRWRQSTNSLPLAGQPKALCFMTSISTCCLHAVAAAAAGSHPPDETRVLAAAASRLMAATLAMSPCHTRRVGWGSVSKVSASKGASSEVRTGCAPQNEVPWPRPPCCAVKSSGPQLQPRGLARRTSSTLRRISMQAHAPAAATRPAAAAPRPVTWCVGHFAP